MAALRTLTRNPVFAAAAILTIALGIGLNTAAYSLMRTVLLQPLPYRDPQRLVQIWETNPRFPMMAVAAPDFLDWKQARSFDGMAAYTIQTMNRGILQAGSTPMPVQAVMASHELFSLLGLTPLRGRAFTQQEEREKKPVAMISERLWRSRFGADAAIVGRAVSLEQTMFTITGVVAQRGAFPAWADLWMPLSLLEPQLETSRKFHPLEVVARLKDGATETAAQQELQGVMHALARQYPATNGGESALLIPLQSNLVAPVRGALLSLWAAVGLVLLIVCVNVAHLVLARASGRSRELAIRTALGATRAHIARVLMTENLLLAFAGGTLGIALAAAAAPLLSRYAAERVPRLEELSFDANVMLFGAAASLIAMLLSGLPALIAASKPASRRGRPRMGRLLIAGEIALAFAVLSGAGLLLRSFGRLMAVDPGFETQGVTAMNIVLPRPAYDWEKSQRWFDQQLAPRLRAMPGVQAVAAGNLMPLTMPSADQIHRFATRFGVPGETYADGQYPVAQIRWNSEEYCRTLGIRLVRGRLLNEADRGKPRNMINETLANRYFPGQDAVGKQLVFGVADTSQSRAEIVGVVGDVRDLSLELVPEPTIYSLNTSMQFALLVRGEGVSAAAVASEVRALEPGAVVERAGPLAGVLRESLARRRFSLTLMMGFAAIAALLAAIGIFGVVNYATGRRMKEFGVRLALGAHPVEVRRLILRETAALAGAGLIAGAWLSWMLSPLYRPLLFDVQPWDGRVWLAAALLLFGASLGAAWIPARKASRLDPSAALRTE